MAVSDDGFRKRLIHVARFVQWKVLCGNTAVIYGPSVCLLQMCWSGCMRIFSRLCIYVFHQQIQIWLGNNDYCNLE